MATINHHTYHHSSSSTTKPRHHPRRRHSLDYSSLSLKNPSTTISLSSHITFSLSSTTPSTTTTTTTTTSSDPGFTLDTLEHHLVAGDFRQADEETRRLLIVLAGESAVKRGYVFFSEVQFIPKEDLKAIDELWRKYSNNQFGYSIQKKIWMKVNKDFTKFFLKVGWMKRLDTEIEQYNYRAFPNEFIWEINGENTPPEGHLPLTNALRGTQLLNSILTHPAFDDDDDDEKDNQEREDDDDQGNMVVVDDSKKKSRLASLRDRLFKPNYGF